MQNDNINMIVGCHFALEMTYQGYFMITLPTFIAYSSFYILN